MKIPINGIPKTRTISINIDHGKSITAVGEGALKPNMGRGGVVEHKEFISEIPIKAKNPALRRQEHRKDAERKREALSDLI